MRALTIYGIADFTGWLLGAYYNVAPQVFFLSPLVTGLVLAYVIAGCLDYLVVPSSECNDVYLNLDGSTAFGSWFSYGLLVVTLGGGISQFFRELWFVGVIAVVVAYVLMWFNEADRAADVSGMDVRNSIGRSLIVYGLATFGALVSQLPILGGVSLLYTLTIAYAVATVVEVCAELLNWDDNFILVSSPAAARR